MFDSLVVDDWLLYVQRSPSAAGARGFAQGTVFDARGEMVASVAQEGLMRRMPDPPQGGASEKAES